jgi:hypothetical protein
MGDVSDLSSGIRLKSRSNAHTRQPWDDDLTFWEDPVTLREIEELMNIAEVKEAASATQHKKPKGAGPPPSNPLRDDGKRSGGKPSSSSSSSKMMTATGFRPSPPLQSQGIHALCQEVT